MFEVDEKSRVCEIYENVDDLAVFTSSQIIVAISDVRFLSTLEAFLFLLFALEIRVHFLPPVLEDFHLYHLIGSNMSEVT